MKVTKYPDGRVEFDDIPTWMVLKLAGLNGQAPPNPKGRPPDTVVVTEALGVSQLQTWQYLTAHDREGGITAMEYATDARLSNSVANNRLHKLVKLGLARKVSRGHFRPGVE